MRFFVVLSTTPDLRSASHIARTLIRKKLAACVSFQSGWKSIYRWKEKNTTSSEVLIVIKTSSTKLSAVQKTILQIHPYKVPEILVLPVTGGFAGYLAWLEDALK